MKSTNNHQCIISPLHADKGSSLEGSEIHFRLHDYTGSKDLLQLWGQSSMPLQGKWDVLHSSCSLLDHHCCECSHPGGGWMKAGKGRKVWGEICPNLHCLITVHRTSFLLPQRLLFQAWLWHQISQCFTFARARQLPIHDKAAENFAC